ncbi:MAG TPA: DUF1592 domain-containing protein [Kofleriaceae bacterium]|nr:DUF1592 domain-containing protein [Kofleriaceae bacterium]
MNGARLLAAVVCACASTFAVAACDDAALPPVADEAPIPARVRLLTDEQYANAVRDLLGESVTVPPLRTPGTAPHQLIHEDVIAVDAALLVQYRMAAEMLAAEVMDRPAGVETATFAERAFRRPLDDGELAALEALEADGGFALVVEAVMQSPDFLYRTELGGDRDAGDANGVVELTAYELAGELSFLLLDSIPDDALWASAKDGTLAQPEVVAAHVERLLATPRVREHLTRVVMDWLEVWKVLDAVKDPALFPELDEALRRSMLDETDRFVRDVLWERRGSLRELLRSRRSFADERVAALYGDSPRAGVLTQASMLTSLATARQESIIRRGIFVHRRLLCTPELGRPPFDAIAGVAPFTSKLSEMQFSHYRLAHLYCRGCHRVIDPPGRALHHYDGLGRWREVDAIGQPIEDTVRMVVPGGDGDEESWVSGPIEMAEFLAESQQVAGCAVDLMTHHAFGIGLTDAQGGVTRRGLHDRFEQSDRDLVDVFRAIATSPAFRKRTRGTP